MFKYISFLSFIITISQSVLAQNSEQFINDSQKIITRTINQLQEKTFHPLDARMFDIAKPSYYDFLNHRKTSHNYNNDHIAIVYYKGEETQFKVNNKITSFCFILNNTKDKNFIPNYLNSGFFDWENMVQYITYHELGHCFSSYESEFDSNKLIIPPKLREAFADMYSIALFYTQNNKEQAQKIIDFNYSLNKDDIHYNPILLKNFYHKLNQLKELSSHPKDVLDLTYTLFFSLTQ